MHDYKIKCWWINFCPVSSSYRLISIHDMHINNRCHSIDIYFPELKYLIPPCNWIFKHSCHVQTNVQINNFRHWNAVKCSIPTFKSRLKYLILLVAYTNSSTYTHIFKLFGFNISINFHLIKFCVASNVCNPLYSNSFTARSQIFNHVTEKLSTEMVNKLN